MTKRQMKKNLRKKLRGKSNKINTKEKGAEERQDRDGRKTSQIRLVRWQQQVEWRRTGINFADTSGQRRPEEDYALTRRNKLISKVTITMIVLCIFFT